MFRKFLHGRLAVIGLSSVLALGAFAGAGVAVASASGGSSSAPVIATTTPSPGATGTPTTNSPQHQAKHAGTKGACRAKFRIAKGILKDVAAKSGIDEKTLVTDLKAGKTLNEILGSNASTVEQQVVADVQAKIEAAEKAGKLTAAQAQKLSARAPEAISKFFSTTHTGGHHDKPNATATPGSAS